MGFNFVSQFAPHLNVAEENYKEWENEGNTAIENT